MWNITFLDQCLQCTYRAKTCSMRCFVLYFDCQEMLWNAQGHSNCKQGDQFSSASASNVWFYHRVQWFIMGLFHQIYLKLFYVLPWYCLLYNVHVVSDAIVVLETSTGQLLSNTVHIESYIIAKPVLQSMSRVKAG